MFLRDSTFAGVKENKGPRIAGNPCYGPCGD